MGWAKGSLSPPGPRPAPRPPSGPRPRQSRAPRGSILRDPVPLPGSLAASALTDPGEGHGPYPAPPGAPAPRGSGMGEGQGTRAKGGTQRNRKGSPRGQGQLPGPMVPSANRKARKATGPPAGISTLRAECGSSALGSRCQRLLPRLGVRRFLSVWGSGFSAVPLELDLDCNGPAGRLRPEALVSLAWGCGLALERP